MWGVGPRISDDLDIDLARRIGTVCRRFEADWRARAQPRTEDNLGEVPDEGHLALWAELEALVRELRPSEETVVRPEAGSSTAPEPQTRRILPRSPRANIHGFSPTRRNSVLAS